MSQDGCPMLWDTSEENETDEALQRDHDAGLSLPTMESWGAPRGKGEYVESPRHRELRLCVERLLETSDAHQVSLEKRLKQRFAFHKPLRVTPVNDRTRKPDPSQSFAVFGIDISATGISFLSQQLVPSRQAVITCYGPDNESLSLLFVPRWVRFTRHSWYQIGGRLVRVLPSSVRSLPSGSQPA